MTRVSCLVLILASACGGSSPEPAKPAPPAPQPTAQTLDDFVPMCRRIFARKETCADDYLPVLLDVRVELNLPPGIGDEVKTKGRDAVLALAHTELARDTQPENVNPLCDSAAANAKQAPPERAHQLLDLGARCEAAAECKAFSTCVVQIDRQFIASGAAAKMQ
jgi:hypothetical protein